MVSFVVPLGPYFGELRLEIVESNENLLVRTKRTPNTVECSTGNACMPLMTACSLPPSLSVCARGRILCLQISVFAWVPFGCKIWMRFIEPRHTFTISHRCDRVKRLRLRAVIGGDFSEPLKDRRPSHRGTPHRNH